MKYQLCVCLFSGIVHGHGCCQRSFTGRIHSGHVRASNKQAGERWFYSLGAHASYIISMWTEDVYILKRVLKGFSD